MSCFRDCLNICFTYFSILSYPHGVEPRGTICCKNHIENNRLHSTVKITANKCRTHIYTISFAGARKPLNENMFFCFWKSMRLWMLFGVCLDEAEGPQVFVKNVVKSILSSANFVTCWLKRVPRHGDFWSLELVQHLYFCGPVFIHVWSSFLATFGSLLGAFGHPFLGPAQPKRC